MRLSLVQSRALLGLQAPAVTVEVHLANGLPSFTLVGLADVEVKEAYMRREALAEASKVEAREKELDAQEASLKSWQQRLNQRDESLQQVSLPAPAGGQVAVSCFVFQCFCTWPRLR